MAGPILRGTTPRIRVRLKTDDLLVGSIEALEYKVWQDGYVLKFGINDVVVDTEANELIAHLTEEQTLQFKTKSSAKLRCRFKVGDEICGTRDYQIQFTGDDVDGVLVDATTGT